MKKTFLFLIILALLGFSLTYSLKKFNLNPNSKIGQKLDSLNGVVVYYNGSVSHVGERNLTKDNYNLGLKYQCVEFVKRYYYERFNHKMPDSYGNAKDFFDKTIEDGSLNPKRNLLQYTNASSTQPKAEDLLIFSGSATNKFGHVAIISAVSDTEIEIIQQNPGPFGKSRASIPLSFQNGKYLIENDRVLGWLRKE